MGFGRQGARGGFGSAGALGGAAPGTSLMWGGVPLQFSQFLTWG